MDLRPQPPQSALPRASMGRQCVSALGGALGDAHAAAWVSGIDDYDADIARIDIVYTCPRVACYDCGVWNQQAKEVCIAGTRTMLDGGGYGGMTGGSDKGITRG